MTERERKRKFLEKYLKLESDKRKIHERINSLRQEQTNPKVILTDMPRGGGKKDLCDYVSELDLLEREYKEKDNEQIKIKSCIYKIKDIDKRMILLYRYVDGMDFYTIAKKIDRAKKTVETLLKESVDVFEGSWGYSEGKKSLTGEENTTNSI